MPIHNTIMRDTPMQSTPIHGTCRHNTVITDTSTLNINMLPGDTPAVGMLHDMPVHDVSIRGTCTHSKAMHSMSIHNISMHNITYAYARVSKFCRFTQYHSVTDAEYMLHNEHCSSLQAHM